MADLETAISRIEAFIRLKRQSMSDIMVEDIECIIAAARHVIPKTTGELSIAKSVLLSDEFVAKFAAALANAPLPSMQFSSMASHVPWCTETGQNVCTCDKSSGRIDHACPLCKLRGHKGALD